MKTLVLLLTMLTFSLGGFSGVEAESSSPALAAEEGECPPGWATIDDTSPYWYENADLNENGLICLHPKKITVKDDK